jgi:small subunit ribosomal protein S9
MTEEPKQPEGETPEEELPEGAPGEPGEGTPSEGAPEPGEESPGLDADAPGPEIEGLEELGQAADAGDEPSAAEGEDTPSGEDEARPADAEEPAAAEGEPAAEGEGPAAAEGESAAEREEPAAAEGEPAAEREQPAAAEGEPAAEREQPAAAEGESAAEREQPAAAEGEPAAEREQLAAAEGEPAAEGEQPAAEERAPAERPRGRRGQREGAQEEVIPGLHLEPDLVLEEQRPEGEYGEYDQYAEGDGAPVEEGEGEEAAEPAPVAHTPLELAADARYHATGKRKSAIARVILKPGEGTYTINGRHFDEYFPRVRLQRMASQPLEAAGYHTRMDVVARIHGGGVSAQATALRHGIARALVEADPALRTEMKRRGYLTRDPREKERKKAGLKKARKRPQFSKR